MKIKDCFTLIQRKTAIPSKPTPPVPMAAEPNVPAETRALQRGGPQLLDQAALALQTEPLNLENEPWLNVVLQQDDVIGSLVPHKPWQWVQGKPEPQTYLSARGHTFILRPSGVACSPGVLLALYSIHATNWVSTTMSGGTLLATKFILEQEVPKSVPKKLEQFLRGLAIQAELDALYEKQAQLRRQLRLALAHRVFKLDGPADAPLIT